MHKTRWPVAAAVVTLVTFGLLACQTAEVLSAEAGLSTNESPDSTLTALPSETDTPAASSTDSPSATPVAIGALRRSGQPSRIATPRVTPEATRTFGQNPRSSIQPSGRPFGNIPAGSRPMFGQITAVNGNQVTVETRGRSTSGGTLTVDLTGSTQYQGGAQSDLRVGTRIAGYGILKSDGSITAQSIAINPSFGGGSRPSQ